MQLTRRTLVKTAFAFALGGALPSFAHAQAKESLRRLHFHNTHTGESLKTVYWEKGSYQPEALKAIAHVLRDHRTGDVHPIDPRLLDLLSSLHRRVDSRNPFEVISGYRSPKSNAWLHSHTSGVDSNSNHMLGKAIDIRLADCRLSSLRDAAWGLQGGGVGYYPASGFIHMDTADIRRW